MGGIVNSAAKKLIKKCFCDDRKRDGKSVKCWLQKKGTLNVDLVA